MLRTVLAAAALLGTMLAGCSGPAAETPSLDLIVPGQWRVSAVRDFSLAWFHNEGTEAVTGNWSLTGQGGAALPAGWNATFAPASATVQPNGTGRDPSTRAYRDWTHTLATLEVPNGTAAGTHALELRFADQVRPVTVTIATPFTQVSRRGDQVGLTYEGRFHSSGDLFDDGAFDTKLGSGQTVPGFDLGLVGLAKDEEATISIPFALAYGDDNSPNDARQANYVKFNGQTLDFKVLLTSLPGPPKVHAGDLACKEFDGVADPRGPFTAQDEVRVRFETTMGNFTVQTAAANAPKTVANFLRYVDDGFYACTTIHRISPGFVVQGGGFLSDHATHKPTRDAIPLEATPEAKNVKWSLSMARGQSPDTATSEFFVNLDDNEALDSGGPGTGYAVFAHLVEGHGTIENITKVKAGQSFGRAGGHYPAEPIIIVKARRV